MNDSTISTTTCWSFGKKIAFRFSFVFILLFIVIFNNGSFPLFSFINRPLITLMHTCTPWFSKNILRYQYDYSIFSNGSGDTSYDWVTLLILVIIGVLVTIIWTLIDTKRNNYNKCYYWLTVFIRYYIAFMLINYGVSKLIHAQMPPPGLTKLMQPLGEFSPMGLAWNFFGFSKGYNIFIGIVEVMAGLLLFRKTMVLGALITVATSLNIMAINYFYDVPVKLMSTALVLLSVFLLLPYLKSLTDLFFKGESSQLKQINRPVFNKTWEKWGLSICKVLLIILFISTQLFGIFNQKKLLAQYFKKSPLYGIYQIETSSEKRVSIPNNWSFLIFEYEGNAGVRDNFYNVQQIGVGFNTSENKMTLNNYTFDYKLKENGDVLLKVKIKDRLEEIRLTKRDPKTFELMNRGFNWIQEYPHYR